MKSVGEAMAVGRTFQESLQKALRSLETGLSGLDEIVVPGGDARRTLERIRRELRDPGPQRLRYLADALRHGLDADEVHRLCRVDPWFIAQIEDLVREERILATLDPDRPDRADALHRLDLESLRGLKRKGFSDGRIAALLGTDEHAVRAHRTRLGLHPVYKRIDSCAAEFRAVTAYMYSTYEEECEAEPTAERKIIVLGVGRTASGRASSSTIAAYMR